MKLMDRIKYYFQQQLRLNTLLKIFVILLCVFIIQVSSGIYQHFFSLLKSIFYPFFIAFVIAYITHPLFSFMESRKIPKGLSILLFWIVLIVAMILILVVLIPMLYVKAIELMSSLTISIHWISQQLELIIEDSTFASTISNYLINFLNNIENWLPNLSTLVPRVISMVINGLTSILIVFIITIYMMIDYEKIHDGILKIAEALSDHLPVYIRTIDEVVGVYFRSLLILMIIKFIEYSFLYFLVGHKDWMIIAILTALGLIVPFVGATIASVIGIVTAFTLPFPNFLCLIVGIVILSNIDAYVLAPMVHSKRSLIQPLWTLFSVFAGSILAGGIGIFFAVPVFLAIRSVIQTYQQRHSHTA
ncbi:MAG: AI-2E family transporter [Erysipelotrichaceae bacterium]|nr:AI-2E family transporter [Erysipelotrichaceae bacterium]